MTYRMRTVWDVLTGAKDAGDEVVIAACRRCIRANRAGMQFRLADWELISDFAEWLVAT